MNIHIDTEPMCINLLGIGRLGSASANSDNDIVTTHIKFRIALNCQTGILAYLRDQMVETIAPCEEH